MLFFPAVLTEFVETVDQVLCELVVLDTEGRKRSVAGLYLQEFSGSR
jgi:hypothetical protein